jgi:hypothetical protein
VSAFEFFFSFYGFILSLSAAELLGGFSRLVQNRRKIKAGALTILLALFVVLDIATFWNQAWLILRNAPFNFALLILGLCVAGVYYVAASLVFPTLDPDEAMDDHFWANRRVVLLCVLGTNLVMGGLLLTVANATGEIAKLGLGLVFWSGLLWFTALTLIAAFARPKAIVMAALLGLLVYQGIGIGRSAKVLMDHGGWPLRGEAPTS